MLFNRQKKVNKLKEDLQKFDYEHLEQILAKFDDGRIIEITLPDGTKLVVKKASNNNSVSRFGRFDLD